MELTNIEAKTIAAIGVGGHMYAPVPIGINGEVLSNRVPLWNDKSSSEMVEEFRNGEFAKEAFRITKNPPLTSWSAFNIMWMKLHTPHIYKKMWKFLFLGEEVTDYSETSGFYLMGAQTNKW